MPFPEIAGPRAESLPSQRSADPDRELYEKGGLLPGPHATLAGPTFEEWLDSERPELA